MMRTSSLSVLLALGTAPALAQTLTADNCIPAVGHSEQRTYHSDFSAPTWSVTGTGNVWDASGVQPFGEATQVTYRAPGDSPYAASYPAATLCDERISGGDPAEWRHYVVDADHAEMIGVSAEAFVGGRTWCTFPFSMGSTYTDDWTVNGNNFSETNTFVASGEIQAPWGTIPNVVMFESAGGFSYYLFEADNLLDPVGTYIPGITVDVWRVETASNVPEAALTALGARYDPLAGTVTLHLPGSTGFTCTLVDANGRTVASARSNGPGLLLSTATCAPGVYTALVTTTDGRRSAARFVVY